MSYSFEKIMDYHKDNRRVYNEIKRSLSKLVPFVGAGLTQFAYGTWPEALKALTDMLADPENVQEVTRLIDDKHYMDAAQRLEELRASANLWEMDGMAQGAPPQPSYPGSAGGAEHRGETGPVRMDGTAIWERPPHKRIAGRLLPGIISDVAAPAG